MEPSPEALPQITTYARDAYERLMRTVRGLDADAFALPSLLPGWTRGHVLTHLARNADSHVRLLNAAAEDRIVEQYPGGAEGRASAIEEGAKRDAAATVADLERASTALFDVWDRLPPEAWTRRAATNWGDRQAWETAWSRWREIEVHHVDLGAGFQARDWPAELVDAQLPSAVETLGKRLPADTRVTMSSGGWRALAGSGATRVTVEGTRAEILAWILGRAEAAPLLARTDAGMPAALPDLAPWG